MREFPKTVFLRGGPADGDEVSFSGKDYESVHRRRPDLCDDWFLRETIRAVYKWKCADGVWYGEFSHCYRREWNGDQPVEVKCDESEVFKRKEPEFCYVI